MTDESVPSPTDDSSNPFNEINGGLISVNILKCMACGSIHDVFEISCEDQDVKGDTRWRYPDICLKCCYIIEADIWISRNCWKSLTPTTAFNELPKISKNEDDEEESQND